ncbi:MAG: hypothetical protein K0R00_927 [Herbinix sp.]|jgi:hypothetical protein|nr:hypothetical protein [Herbinix sp.]
MSDTTVTMPLEEFDSIRTASSEFKTLRRKLSECTKADLSEYKEELKRLDIFGDGMSNEDIDKFVLDASSKIKIIVNKSKAIEIFLEYLCFGKSGDYGYFDEMSKDEIKNINIVFE